MLSKIFLMAAVAAMGAIGAFSSSAVQQQDEDGRDIDVVIVNQDGEEVAPTNIQGKIRVQAGSSNNRVKINGDKIIIEDENGETKEIDISGARSVAVQQSVKSVNDNGKQVSETRAKAIIIGPDGEKQVIELGPIDGAGAIGGIGEIELPGIGEMPKMMFRGGFPGSFEVAPTSKFMIGIHCEPASAALKSQLKLDNGLVVKQVSPDSPAASNVEKYDILMFANQKPLEKVRDLTAVVDNAGSEKHSISITAVRSGKEVELVVTPTERPANSKGDRMMFLPDRDLQFRELGPGIIMGDFPGRMPELRTDMQEAMEQMQRQIEDMNERMNQFNDK